MLFLCLARALIFAPAVDDLVLPLSKTVVYEANLRSSGGSHAFKKLTGRLDQIRSLGANVLWLMPVQPVGKLRSAGGLGSPYAIANFDAVNPEFGTDEELRQLISAAHQRKMAVILDWVANHTAWDHPWIAAHPGWYKHDGKGNIVIPPGTNWQDVAALDYSHAELREAMIASMLRWVRGYGIDGFRCDSADFVPFEFWKQAIPRLRDSADRRLLMLAEGTREDQYGAGFDLTYGWDFAGKLRAIFHGAKARELKEVAEKERAHTPQRGARLRFITNHDISAWEGSLPELYKGREGAMAATVVSTLYDGAPLIYSGQECLWPKRIPIFETSDVDTGQDPNLSAWIGRLMALRSQHPALQNGVAEDRSNDDVILLMKQSSGETALVIANVRDHPSAIAIPPDLRSKWTDGYTQRSQSLPKVLTLPPFGFRILFRT